MKSSPARKSSYEPLDFLVIRAPLLSVEKYLALAGAQDLRAAISVPGVFRALAVGSPSLSTALEKSGLPERKSVQLDSKLLRYLIRMSTRPTPYGLFAGVALARWGNTDLALDARHQTRTRPDMEWILGFIQKLESQPEVLKELKLFANPAIYIRDGRLHLSERASLVDSITPTTVSMRATAAVRCLLSNARQPIPYRELTRRIEAEFPGTDKQKVEDMISALWQETVLLTELRPALTGSDAARRLCESLSSIPIIALEAERLESWLAKISAWDQMPVENSVEAFRSLASESATMYSFDGETSLQVDMGLRLSGKHLSRAVGEEAAFAAELLLHQTARNYSDPVIGPYRQAFRARYGEGVEVPLLELLHPAFGLGPVEFASSTAQPVFERNRIANSTRDQYLYSLAVDALRDGVSVVELDDAALKALQSGAVEAESYPASLDLFISVAAESAAALDRGEFQIAVAPHAGSSGAGRSLGRFVDMLGVEALEALQSVSQREKNLYPDRVWAELIYLPRKSRSANVSIRPAVRSNEILWGVQPGVSWAKTIPLEELVVGVERNRFYVHWPREGADVSMCAGHMLNNQRAPALIRSIAEISRDGMASVTAFQWGTAAQLPFLPRIKTGRIVLAPAQWRVTNALLSNPSGWRTRWNVPRHVYLVENDNRLLLDLDDPRQSNELMSELKKKSANGKVILQEVFPSLEQAWLGGPAGHYLSEFVVPLILRSKSVPVHGSKRFPRRHPQQDNILTAAPSSRDRLRAPGSDWLYVKFYGDAQNEEALISRELTSFATRLVSCGLVRRWHFVRYNDPAAHVRLRLQGKPDDLTRSVWPQLCDWAQELMKEGRCLHFAIDTYEREIDRYGGNEGLGEVEDIFSSDSFAVSQMLEISKNGTLHMDRVDLATISIDNLLGSLGIPESERIAWCRESGLPRSAGSIEYRKRQGALVSSARSLAAGVKGTALEALGKILSERHTRVSAVSSRLYALEKAERLSKSVRSICHSVVHLHCNRLLGTDKVAEQTALGQVVRLRLSLDSARAL